MESTLLTMKSTLLLIYNKLSVSISDLEYRIVEDQVTATMEKSRQNQ